MTGTATIRLAEGLLFFVPVRRRAAGIDVVADGVSTVGHLVTSLGVPLTEVGGMLVNGEAVPASYRPGPGDAVDVTEATRPQPAPTTPPRFLLDVHLGTLARRLRMLGIDAAYDNDADDEALAARAAQESRILLTQDRGLLRRRAVVHGAYVRGHDPDDQLRDVLDRFRPSLSPWSRCPTCNDPLVPVDKDEVADQLKPGTRRSYEEFVRCNGCGQVYWRGAHHGRLPPTVAELIARAGSDSCR